MIQAKAAEQGDADMAPTYKRVAPYLPTPLMYIGCGVELEVAAS